MNRMRREEKRREAKRERRRDIKPKESTQSKRIEEENFYFLVAL
jgi:hypothetical protein